VTLVVRNRVQGGTVAAAVSSGQLGVPLVPSNPGT
jgi:hypothetical protein